MLKRLSLLPVLAGLILAGPAWADDAAPLDADLDGIAQDDSEDEDDDFLDDLLNEDSTDTVEQEVDAMKRGDLDDNIGVAREEIVLPEEEQRRRRVIKTLQAKNFLKIGRFEISPHVGFVANDPFLNRYIGGAGAGYHATEIFEIELDFAFAPDLGTTDWKPLTKQLVNENRVSPDISKLLYYGSLSFGFSPIYGKVAVVGRKIILFDIFGSFGMGAARTQDDLEALQAEQGDQRAEATASQIHPTTNLGGGLRVIFSENVAARLEAKSLIYIETVQSTTLEMKNNLILQASVSIFIPGMRS